MIFSNHFIIKQHIMLLYFRVSNSRSIDKEIEISFIAGDYGKKLPKNIYPVKKYGFSVVKTLALYGANASGKSNILKAISDSTDIIEEGIIIKHSEGNLIKNEIRFYPNKNNIENKNKPTSYTYGLLIDEVYYEYQIQNNQEKITSERLWQFEPNKDEPITLFERKYNREKYIWFFHTIFDDNFKYIIKSVTNPYTTALSEAANYVKNNEIEIYNFIYNIYNRLSGDISTTDNTNLPINFYPEMSLEYITEDKSYKKELLKVLAIGNFNITDIKVILNKEYKIQTAYTFHINNKKEKIKYDFFTEESIGTQQFIGYFHPWYLTIENNDILIVDEFGNSLHPLLAKYLVSLFYKKKGSHQLIFATHYTELLNREEIRDDQIYLVDKDKDGNTIVSALSDYNIPDDVALDKIYLQGVLKGVPFINYNDK
jgi:hypothetical protein